MLLFCNSYAFTAIRKKKPCEIATLACKKGIHGEAVSQGYGVLYL